MQIILAATDLFDNEKEVPALGTRMKNLLKNGKLIVKKHYKELFILMDSFWYEIKDFDFDLKYLFKVRNHLENLERKQQETK